MGPVSCHVTGNSAGVFRGGKSPAKDAETVVLQVFEAEASRTEKMLSAQAER
jgi:hypothetical protein